jgi:hypothetical protein
VFAAEADEILPLAGGFNRFNVPVISFILVAVKTSPVAKLVLAGKPTAIVLSP